MADQKSARPTGNRVPIARPGRAQNTNDDAVFGGSWRAIAILLAVSTGLHVVLSGFGSDEATNAAWPSLAIAYALLLATIVVIGNTKHVSPPFAIAADPAQRPDSTLEPLANRPLASELNDTPVSCGYIAKTNSQEFNSSRPAPRQSTPVTRAPRPSLAAFRHQPDWSDLMSQVSHELRTPLNAMLGFTEAMNAELLGPLENPKYREYLAHIRDSGHDLLKSAEDTLAMTSLLATQSIQENQACHTNLQDTIEDAWEFVARYADDKCVVVQMDAVANTVVVGEARALRQSFINLLSEAIKVARKYQTVRVKARQTGDLVDVAITVATSHAPHASVRPTLSSAIAQALLELQGTTLVTSVDALGNWTAATLLECRMQSDFFEDSIES